MEQQPFSSKITRRLSPVKRPDKLGGDYLMEGIEALEHAGNARGL